MRALFTIVSILLFLTPSGAQSFTSFQLLDECPTWKCVVELITDPGLELHKSVPWRVPLRSDARISSGYGYRVHPLEGKHKFHGGVDLAAPQGTLVLASGAGLATRGLNAGLGKYIEIDHLNGFVSRYGHLAAFGVDDGTYVSQGQVIGAVGVTGLTTGSHVHWSVYYRDRHLDPLELRAMILSLL